MKLAPALGLACLLLLPNATLAAQSRTRRTSTPQRRPTASRTQKPATSASTSTLNEARIRLTDELKTLTRFLYLYGRTSIGVENNEKQAREGGAVSPEAQAILNRSRATVLESLGNIRDRLDKLELYFRTTPGLEQHYRRLSGVGATAATAEQRANSGQLDAAGRALIEVANQLADVLLEM
ncbi:MAG TPA: hypothetical protein VJ842_13725 [Pyrinomonadaceae bacterium]|nr:hypothetical protein [Pyrinomonadaceae bacterium]